MARPRMRFLFRHGLNLRRVEIGEGTAPSLPPLNILPSAAPTGTAEEGDIYWKDTDNAPHFFASPTSDLRVPGMLSGSATYDAASLADGVGATTTVTVTGAALGDFANASFGVDLQGITVTAYVSAANTVSVRLQNESGGTLDLASTTLRAMVIKL